ncbi:MAG TPA: alpha-2-macroglobulin family protein, partial [Opitutales bacterium]|nr:alpha-2-macroglobulin family protein [Opitutales bacterium]
TSTCAKPFFQPTLTPPAKDGAGDSAGRAPDGNAAPPASATLGTGIWTVVTDCDSAGRAVLPVQMPDRISLWVAAVVASAPDGGAGAGFAAVETKESLSLSLSTPTRVFVGDFLDLSAVMSNHLSEPREAACSFESAGQEPSSPLFEPCTRLIQPGSSATMGWTVSYRAPGRVSLSASVATAEKTARITREIDVAASPFSRRRGISALLMQGEVSLANTQGLHVDNATLSVTASPSSVALAALSGLLADPSPGSTEAAGRLAAVSSVRRLLSRMHYDPSSIAAAMQASGVSDYERDRQDADLRTILSAQGVNGAWGWLSPAGASPFTTAYNLVMLGLCDGPIAEKLGPALEKGRDYAASELVAGTQPPDMQVLLLYGLASRDLKGARPSRLEARALVSLMRIQDRLSPMALSCLTLCAAQYGFGDEASGLAAALRARAVRSRDSRGEGVAHWPCSALFGSVPAGEGECTAMAVLALVAVDGSRGELVQDGLRYIFSRAENFAWDGPRETTLCTLALRDYSAHSLETDIAATCLVGAAGNTPERYDAASEKQPALPTVRPLPDSGGDSGRISADIVRSSGQSPLFVSLSADQTHPSDSGAESGLDGTRISRSFLRVVQVPTLLRGFDEKIVELEPGSILRVGERIETVIVVDTKRTIPEAVIIQPMPGFVTWHPSASDTSVVNLDNSSQMPGFVASFSTTDEFKLGIENLPPGRWEIRIPMRVDFEGDFAVPPALIRIPQKASLSASGGLMKVRCEGATTQNAPQ